MILANKQPSKARVRRQLKLRVELIPKPLAKLNLRSSEGIGKARWDKLRRGLVKLRGACCEICGSTGPRLQAHEVWNYRENGSAGTATLLRIEIVCIDCHDIHHWVRTTILLEERKITAERYKYLRRHFRVINDCRQQVFDDHLLKSARIWKRRSKKEWTIDWGEFESLVEQVKEARDLWAKRNPDNGEYFNVRPGHHMPSRCPKCGAIGKLAPIEVDQDEMSEGEEVEYEAGMWGYAFCGACQSNVFWQV
ncbi:hypothetical protein EI171_02910 [Bradyrhizobium sp. LCT2]|uniref:hypothetical protein n=1 Tax=Bradyrhizobium sp. LCT2 TaxID=2493093 RepID=UPI001374122B|nr:hypothetical protein [Bradyrhizobium sp. LCT2]QHP66455.1 hypothetical protein EI171_02910 [Bradyrhizobium sp. LCT2]